MTKRTARTASKRRRAVRRVVLFNDENNAPDHPVAALMQEPVELKPMGRPHLDGSAPGTGTYVEVLSVSLRPDERKVLEQAGEGNRSEGVRRLLAFWQRFGQPRLTRDGKERR